jgi:ubiquinone/menaquinone biosynthesis C-methylase UbiE
MSQDAVSIKEKVRARYGAIAESQSKPAAGAELTLFDSRPVENAASCGCGTDCCSPTDLEALEGTGLAGVLYGQTDLADLPDTVTNISLGCGNPTALASLKPGETVLDLGSGGGIDCFIAARAVGPTGHVIGVDMTDNMLALANQNKAKLGLTNVEFRKGEIEAMPVDDNTANIIISNCVINLSPDKDAVFREAFRVLKPGGRFVVSDIVSEGEIPEPLRSNINAWAGCISGALDQEDYLGRLRQVGFTDVHVQSRTSYGIEVIDELDESSREALSEGVDWATVPENARMFSANIIAYKPNEQ